MPKKHNDPIKPPYLDETFEPWQVKELVKCKKDFIYFATNYCYIETIDEKGPGSVLFKPYPYQTIMLEHLRDYKHLIFMIGRQQGKTTLSALYILWRAIFHENETILITGYNMDSAIEPLDRVKFTYMELPYWIKPGVTVNNTKSFEFENGSEILTRATTKSSGRGLSISLLYADELAMVDPPAKQRDFWASVQPTLSNGGDCIVTSTPISDEDTFANVWNSACDIYDSNGNENVDGIGKNGFKAIKFTWEDHPNRDEKWRDTEIAKIGKERFLREYCCDFLSDTDTLIDPLRLGRMKGIEPIKKSGEVRVYKKIEGSKTYMVTLDPSMGTGGDFSAIQVFSLPEFEQVAEWRHNRNSIPQQIKTLKEILDFIHRSGRENSGKDPDIYWTIENNSIGEAANIVISDTGEENFRGTYITEKRKTRGKRTRKGFSTTNRSKVEACIKFKNYIETDKVKIYSKPLVSELKNYVSSGAGYAAKSGETDDLVAACLLIIRLSDQIKLYDPEFEEQLSQGIETDEESGRGPLGFVV